MKKILTALFFSFVLCLTYGAELRFKDAEIVLPEKPSWTAVIAAQELQYHLQKMTKGRFPIVKKSSGKYTSSIYVGDRSKAAATGFPVKNIKADGFLRGVKGKDLYIAGSDDKMYKKGMSSNSTLRPDTGERFTASTTFWKNRASAGPPPGKDMNISLPGKKSPSPEILKWMPPVFHSAT